MDAVRERSTAAPRGLSGLHGFPTAPDLPIRSPSLGSDGPRPPAPRGASRSPQRRSMTPAHRSKPLLLKALKRHIERLSAFGSSSGAHLYPKSTAALLFSTASPAAQAQLCIATPALPVGTRSRRRLQPSPKRGHRCTAPRPPPPHAFPYSILRSVEPWAAPAALPHPTGELLTWQRGTQP